MSETGWRVEPRKGWWYWHHDLEGWALYRRNGDVITRVVEACNEPHTADMDAMERLLNRPPDSETENQP